MVFLINGAWSCTAAGASQLQRLGKWAWQKIPASAQNTLQQEWGRRRPFIAPDKTLSNLFIGFFAAQTISNISPITAQVTGLLATWGASKLETPHQYLKIGLSLTLATVAGLTAQAAAGVLLPAAAASGLQLVAGLGTGLATLMATNPNHITVLKIPNGPLLNLHTPSEETPPIEPEKIIPQLLTKISQFKHDQPAGMFWERPVQPPVQIPQAASLIAARENTDAKATIFVENGSIYTALCSIHGGENTENVNSRFIRIAQEASGRNKPSLWSLYKKYFPELSFFQKVKAQFWYFIYYNLGIFPNSIRTFMTNLLNALRKNLEEGKTDKLNMAAEKLLKLASSFLGILNKATEDFAKRNLPVQGTLADYQEQEINQLGDPDILAKVKAKLKPGENLGKKMMEELCEQFTLTLLDEFFPRVPFFAKLKEFRFWGLRIGIVFDVLDWAFGRIINAIIRRIIKTYLPRKVNHLIQLGIEKTLPGQYPFKIALANTLTNQIEELKNVLARNGKPIRLSKNDNLIGVIDKLLNTLELKKLGIDPMPDAIGDKLEELRKKKDQHLRERMRDVLVEGGQHIIQYYTHHPENIEKMFADLCELSSRPFQPGAEMQNEAAYLAAKDRLKNSVHSFVAEQIKDTVLRGEIMGPNPRKFKEDLIDGIHDRNQQLLHKGLLPAQKETTMESLGALKVVIDNMNPMRESTFKDLDHCVEILNDFAQQAEKLDVDLYSPSVRNAFYFTVSPIYQEVLQIMDQIIDLQKLQRRVHIISFQEKLRAVKLQLDRLLTKVRALQKPQVHFPQQHVPEPVLQLAIKYVGEPLTKQIQQYFDSAYELVSSSTIYEAAARLGMGEMIRTYKAR